MKRRNQQPKTNSLWLLIPLCLLLASFPALAGTFRDDFEDGNLKGWLIDEEAETIEIINGEVVITDFDRDIVSQLWFNNKQKMTNFTVSFDGKVIRSFDSWPYMWLYFRVNEVNNVEGCGAVVSLSPNPNVMWCHLICWNAGGFWLPGVHEVPINLTLNTWHHVTIKMEVVNLTVWLNDELMQKVDWSDQPSLPKTGPLGLGAGGAEVHFDNFVIISDDIRPVQIEAKLATNWGRIKR